MASALFTQNPPPAQQETAQQLAGAIVAFVGRPPREKVSPSDRIAELRALAKLLQKGIDSYPDHKPLFHDAGLDARGFSDIAGKAVLTLVETMRTLSTTNSIPETDRVCDTLQCLMRTQDKAKRLYRPSLNFAPPSF